MYFFNSVGHVFLESPKVGSEDRLTQVRKNKAMAAHSRIQAPFLEAGAGGTGGKLRARITHRPPHTSPPINMPEGMGGHPMGTYSKLKGDSSGLGTHGDS